MVNLRAAFKTGKLKNPQRVRDAALEINSDLEDWEAVVPSIWHYDTVDADDGSHGSCYDGKAHAYLNSWVAEAWNNWRSQRLMVNKIIVENEDRSDVPDTTLRSAAVSIIQEMSTDICISASTFTGASRKFLPISALA